MGATPRPSATVVIARDSDAGPEFLFVRRRSGDAFGDAYTFPGGVLDDDEHLARGICVGHSAAEADEILQVESDGLDYFAAAVRETFEETGVLLASDVAPKNLAKLRAELDAGDRSWSDLLEQYNATIACNKLHYFAHWITPTALPKRWSTRFFLTRMPEGQTAEPDGSEVNDCQWLSANEALAGDWQLPYPTRKTVESFAAMESVAALIDWVRARQQLGVSAIQPELRDEGGKRRIFLPRDAD